MKINDKIKIVLSNYLYENRLTQLAGRDGIVKERVTGKNEKTIGAWVELMGEPFLGQQEWYIPVNSMTHLV